MTRFISWWLVVPYIIALADARRLTTQHQECMRFLALGDWGTLQVARTAMAMAHTVAEGSSSACRSRPESIFLLGDNFYESGIANTTDPKVKTYFEDNFLVPAFDGIQFSVIAGNHDHHLSVQAQIDLNDTRWYFPSKYYSRIFAKGDIKILVAFIETWDLIGGESWERVEQTEIVDKTQLAWLNETLSTTEHFDFKIVVGHYPVYSVRQKTAALVEALVPLFKTTGVSAYIHGHDHLAQIFKIHDVAYIGSGNGGGREQYDGIKDRHGLVWASEHTPGYVDMTVTKTSIVFDFLEVHGLSPRLGYSLQIDAKHQIVDETHLALTTMIKNKLLGDW